MPPLSHGPHPIRKDEAPRRLRGARQACWRPAGWCTTDRQKKCLSGLDSQAARGVHGSTRASRRPSGTLRMGLVCARSPWGVLRPSRAHCCQTVSLRSSDWQHAVHHNEAVQVLVARRHVESKRTLSAPHHAACAHMRPVGVTRAVGWSAEQARKHTGVPHSIVPAVGEVDGHVGSSGGTADGRGPLPKLRA